jgi:hypothetical protein
MFKSPDDAQKGGPAPALWVLPVGRRYEGKISFKNTMNQAAATVMDHDEQVQQTEVGGDDDRKITSDDALRVKDG